VFEDTTVEAKAKARSFRIKATYTYEIHMIVRLHTWWKRIDSWAEPDSTTGYCSQRQWSCRFTCPAFKNNRVGPICSCNHDTELLSTRRLVQHTKYKEHEVSVELTSTKWTLQKIANLDNTTVPLKCLQLTILKNSTSYGQISSKPKPSPRIVEAKAKAKATKSCPRGPVLEDTIPANVLNTQLNYCIYLIF